MLVLLLESQREFSVKFEKQSLSTRRLIFAYEYVWTENVSCKLFEPQERCWYNKLQKY